MLSIIDRIVLHDTVTSEDVQSLNVIQKQVAYKLIYSDIPFDKYHNDIHLKNVNLDDFQDSPNFQEYILFLRKSKTLDQESLREFIESYPESKWMTRNRREAMLFGECNVIKSPLSHYMKEIYELNTFNNFPNCWKLIVKLAPINKHKINNLEQLTQYEKDCISQFKFIYRYDTYLYKLLSGRRGLHKNILAYIMREIITLCDYSDNLTCFKKSILIKYYAILGDFKNSLSIRAEFNREKDIQSFTDLLICLAMDRKCKSLEKLMLENLELCYQISITFRSDSIMVFLPNLMKYCSEEFKSVMTLIFGDHFNKLYSRSRKLIYYLSFSLDSECIICCKMTDRILKCLRCNKAVCCTTCILNLVNRRKCMLCRFTMN